MDPLVLQAAGFAFSAGTSFGPLHTLLMNVTLAQGWRVGMLLVLTPLLTDIPIILLMLFILRSLPPVAVPLLNIIGGIAVFFIAYSTYRALKNPKPVETTATQSVGRQTILKGMAVNFLNPGPYIYWGTISGPLFLEALNVSAMTGAMFMLMFYGVFLGIMAIFVMIFDRLRTVDARLTQTLSYASLVILAFLGIQLLIKGIGGLQS